RLGPVPGSRADRRRRRQHAHSPRRRPPGKDHAGPTAPPNRIAEPAGSQTLATSSEAVIQLAVIDTMARRRESIPPWRDPAYRNQTPSTGRGVRSARINRVIAVGEVP